MRDKIEKVVDLILPQFGVYDPGERDLFLTSVYRHWLTDRERYVSLEKKEGRRFYGAPPQEGRICKLLPLAVNFEESGEDSERSLSFTELHLMVTETRVRLVMSSYGVTYYENLDPSIFFPSYTVADPFNLPENMQLLDSEEMQVYNDPRERQVLPMAMRAICKIYDGIQIYQIPIKAERCMTVMRLTPPKTYKMESGEEVEGVLIPLGSTQTREEKCTKEEAVICFEELCILKMQDEARYVIRTNRDITSFKMPEPGSFDPFDDDDDDDCDAMLAGVREEKTYRFVQLDDIKEKMSAYY